jgi:hypothetical protein
MTEFESDLLMWLDADGLMGNKKNPERWSTGNAVLETAIAHQVCLDRKETILAAKLESSVIRCWYGSALHKNPGRVDQITHDDLIGFASMHAELASLIANVGVRNGWNLSNQASVYFDSQANLAHQAYYLAASDVFECGLWGSLVFWISACLSAFVSDLSGIRLSYLMVNNRPPKQMAWLFRPAFDFLFKKRFKSFQNVLLEYYGNKDHVLVKWAL